MDQRAFAGPIGTRVDRRSALHQEFDWYTAGCDPAMRSVHVQAIAIADRSVMNHQTAVASPRAGPEMIEFAAFVVNYRGLRPSLELRGRVLSRSSNEVNTYRSWAAARLHADLSGE